MSPVYWLVLVGSRQLQRVKSRDPYRLVLFDLPPVLVGDGLVAFAPNLGTAMLVVEDPRIQGDELAHSINLFVGRY
jgi:protein-tyrosine kinase